jgi:hypothetical protein
VVILSGSTRYSPEIDLAFYFGRNFAAARQLEALLGDHRFYYHIQQYSWNRAHMNGLSYDGPYRWAIDIGAAPASLASEVAAAIHGIGDPFFARFADIEAARDAVASDDPWCFGGAAYAHQLLLLDAALGDLAHFEAWAHRVGVVGDSVAEELSLLRARS